MGICVPAISNSKNIYVEIQAGHRATIIKMDFFSAKLPHKPHFLCNRGATNQDMLLFATLQYIIEL